MELYSGQINKLIDELAALPGIGSKSAQRLAFHLINMPKDRVDRLANVMIEARANVRYCKECYTLTDKEICPVCANPRRDHHTIMVVENTRDLAAYEKTGKYEGVYQAEGTDGTPAGRCAGSDHCDQFQPGGRDYGNVYQ